MTVPIGRSRSASRRFSNRRARSLSVKIPSSRECSSSIKHRPGASPRAGQPHEDGTDGLLDVRPAELPAGAHHFLDPHELASQAAGRVIQREILGA